MFTRAARFTLGVHTPAAAAAEQNVCQDRADAVLVTPVDGELVPDEEESKPCRGAKPPAGWEHWGGWGGWGWGRQTLPVDPSRSLGRSSVTPAGRWGSCVTDLVLGLQQWPGDSGRARGRRPTVGDNPVKRATAEKHNSPKPTQRLQLCCVFFFFFRSRPLRP